MTWTALLAAIPERVQTVSDWAIVVAAVTAALGGVGTVVAWLWRRAKAAGAALVDKVNEHIHEQTQALAAGLKQVQDQAARIDEHSEELRGQVSTIESRTRELVSNGGASIKDQLGQVVRDQAQTRKWQRRHDEQHQAQPGGRRSSDPPSGDSGG